MKGMKKKSRISKSLIIASMALPLAFSVFGLSTLKASADEGDLNVGDIIEMGQYEQDDNLENGKETIRWKVLSVEEDRALVISERILEDKKFDPRLNTGVEWASSSLRSWLNSDFMSETFTEDERGRILETTLSNGGNAYYLTPGSADTTDRIFCLSLDEAKTYFGDYQYYSDTYMEGYNQNLLASPTKYVESKLVCINMTKDNYNSYQLWDMVEYGDGHYNKTFSDFYSEDVVGRKYAGWWLRTPGENYEWVCVVSDSGAAGDYCQNRVMWDTSGVRPAMYISLEKKDTFTGIREEDGISYLYENGEKKSDSWYSDSTGKYHSDADAKLQKGLTEIEGQKYCFDESTGAMRFSWVKIEGKWYYFNPDTGVMQTGLAVIDKGTYYFDSDGIMQTKWQKIDSEWYFFKSSGEMAIGWQKVGTKWFYFNAKGLMVTGWQKIGGKWYCFKSSGEMMTGWNKIDSKWYYFASSGIMKTGWLQDGGKWYFFNSTGAMHTGWKKLNDKWYYFSQDGAMVTGTKKIGNKTYKFSSNGVCLNP